MFYRSQKDSDHPYLMISKEVFQDHLLSLKAKALLASILCMPDDWKIYLSEFASRLKENRLTVGRIMKELINAGYIERTELKGSDGRFEGYEYDVYELRDGKTRLSDTVADVEKRQPTVIENRSRTVIEKPSTVKPSTDNVSLLSINLTKEKKETEEEEVPSNIDHDSDIAMQEHYQPSSSSSDSLSLKTKEQDDAITKCKQIIGEINAQQDDDWKTLLYHNTTIQAEFDRLEEGGKLGASNLLLLAKSERSPRHFIVALRKYKGGKPVSEDGEYSEKSGCELELERQDRMDEKAAESETRLYCERCGDVVKNSDACKCGHEKLISAEEIVGIVDNKRRLIEQVHKYPEQDMWREFLSTSCPEEAELVEKIESANTTEVENLVSDFRGKYPNPNPAETIPVGAAT